MVWLWSTAFAASPWTTLPPTVSVDVVVTDGVEAVAARLADLGTVFTEIGDAPRRTCVVPHHKTVADGRVLLDVTWVPSWVTARTQLWVAKQEPGLVRWTAQGNQTGFDVDFRLTPIDGGTWVRAAIAIDPLPWPVRRLFALDIAPAWEGCLSRLVRGP
ncbi:MAG: hypothetical protein RLZZ383_2484 [Pseudomonadota bacterium]|jgi:hypothetical protein